MTNDKNKKAASTSKDDVMHGRSFAGAQFASSEREQTRDIERTVKNPPDKANDDDDVISDAEIDMPKAADGR